MSKIINKIRNRVPSYRKRMIGISIDISAQIFEFMKENDMNQRELAVALGKKESEISKWLSGSHNFTIETIAKIEEVFGRKIILVPLYAFEDLGYSHEMKATVNSAQIDYPDKFPWGYNNDDYEKSLKRIDICSETTTSYQNYGKAENVN